ncbi:hypothetical protein PPSIR1_31383 [Plesiocystis pacifica SIR-1]|uniref:SHSP domain-containing protein n=1 Tax=Plesiocystis pacifica SIR-1 TaxID=391625 RepID=A6GDD9_9BACT|nr:Hsp20/alpha crystallin family protein [Plesiocystis pacifica]EDM76130.1 hypothetical protein PPSIR1_31383 [Plesiocystis pacifica SIR-1]
MSKPEPQTALPTVRPLVDVFENGSEFLLVADLPGVTHEGLELLVDEGELALSATAGNHRYERRFELADSVDAEAIEAKLERGELRVHLPKRSEAQVRRVPIH